MGSFKFDTSEFEDPEPSPAYDAPQVSPNPAARELAVGEEDESLIRPSESSRSKVRKPKKRKLPYRSDVVVDGKRYKGRRVSRGEADLDIETLGLVSDPSQEDLDLSRGSDVESDALEEEEGRQSDERDESASEDGSFGDTLNEEEDDDPAEQGGRPERNSSASQRLKAEERAVAARLADAERKERSRAKAVKRQKEIYDTVVDFRIRVQPMMLLAKKFPILEQRATCPLWLQGEDLAEALKEGEASLSSLCTQLEKAWRASWTGEEDKASDVDFEKWRDAELDRWGKKINESSGVVPKGGFKTFDTTVSAQMRAAIASGKHLQRTRRIRESFPLVGLGLEMEQGASDLHYDDGELYRTLLREIIESGDAAGGSLRYAQLSKTGKVKKKMDRSFAKGRRLKYDVHEKLVGFLAPVPLPDPGPLDEIIAALFGRRGTVKPPL